MRSNRRAYTLLELVLVLAVIVLVASLAIPFAKSMFASSHVTASMDTIKARLSEARARAMSEGRPYSFAIVDNTGKFRVAPQKMEGDVAPGDSTDADDAELAATEGALPGDVLFCHSESSDGPAATPAGDGTWTHVVTFRPNGTANQDVQITIATPGGRPAILRLQAVTGTVTVAALSVEGRQQ